MDFQEFPKMARLSREAIVTEKIDGTNAQIHILAADAEGIDPTLVLASQDGLVMLAGSRTRYIVPASDNHGWAAWVRDHRELWVLGPGRHFGEWWGSGIQRGYGLQKGEKRFSLFNVIRWCAHDAEPQPIKSADPRVMKIQERVPACCSLVPILTRHEFGTLNCDEVLNALARGGSHAAPGFMQPEGIVVWHVAGNVGFKKTLEKDDEPKSVQR